MCAYSNYIFFEYIYYFLLFLVHFQFHLCQICIKHRSFILAINFDYLTYFKNRKEPAQDYKNAYKLKKID